MDEGNQSLRMPNVSVIVPCYNEERTIGDLLAGLYSQSYPLSDFEVVISDGISEDKTREVIRSFSENHQELAIRVIDNIKQNIPSAINAGIKAARGSVIVRLDAHSTPASDYLSLCVEALNAGIADNVGGMWEIKPGGEGTIARSIAVAASHPLGVGDARYRYSDRSAFVDTVPFGSFYKSLVDKIGYFDESLLTNEDYEFNTRIRKAGGKIWFDPKIRSTYYARPSLSELAKQYWRYGYWKARMLRSYPGTLRWRQLLPPLFLVSLFITAALSLVSNYALIVLVAQLSIYVSLLLIVGLYQAVKHRLPGMGYGVPVSIATMHFSWGSAFLWSVVKMLTGSGNHA